MERPITVRQGLRERKNAEAKRALYNAAMDLFREKGFDETLVDEIAERAGFSRATFFNHFKTKQGVLRYYGQEIQDRIEQVIDNAERTASPLELIRQVVFTMAHEAEEHSAEVKLIFTYSMRDPSYLSDPTPSRKRVWEILTELVARAQEQKEIRQDMPAREVAIHILSLYHGVVLAIVSDLGDIESLLHSVWQFILGACRTQDDATRSPKSDMLLGGVKGGDSSAQ